MVVVNATADEERRNASTSENSFHVQRGMQLDWMKRDASYMAIVFTKAPSSAVSVWVRGNLAKVIFTGEEVCSVVGWCRVVAGCSPIESSSSMIFFFFFEQEVAKLEILCLRFSMELLHVFESFMVRFFQKQACEIRVAYTPAMASLLKASRTVQRRRSKKKKRNNI